MSKRIHLTAAVGDYDLHRSLILGEVQPDGVDLTVLTLRSEERHWRTLRNLEFDIAELSMSSYLLLRNEPQPPLIAIPVFPHRRFRHSYLFVNPHKNIKSPKDLQGKRIGLRSWQATMGVWTRGILQEEYGVDLRSVDWYTQDEEIMEVQPEGFRIQRVAENKDVEKMLLDGELDAFIFPDIPKSFLLGNPNIDRLFSDHKQEEIRYFRKTGIFPIMHTVVIKTSLLEQYPWVALNVLKAFRESMEDAWERMKDPRKISLAWVRELIEEERSILGPDPWPIGLEPNRHALQTLLNYSRDQGMLQADLSVEELFYPATRAESPDYYLKG